MLAESEPLPSLRCRDLFSLSARLLLPKMVQGISSHSGRSQKLLLPSLRHCSASASSVVGFCSLLAGLPHAPSAHGGLFALAEQNRTSCPSAATPPEPPTRNQTTLKPLVDWCAKIHTTFRSILPAALFPSYHALSAQVQQTDVYSAN